MAFELMDFQRDGANLLAQSRRAMLVWDAGVGKTPTAVRASVKAGARRVIVFCPPIAVSVWREHFKDWGNLRDIRVLDASNASKPYSFMQGGGVRIIPYSRVSIAAGAIIKASLDEIFDVAILDEAHYLKNPDAARTKAVYGPGVDLKGTPLGSARHVWCLSGTPILNHAQEFWSHLHALRPDLIVLPQLGVMDERTFVERFCVTQTRPFGEPRIVGSKNTTELAERIKPFIDRKRMKDVLKDMPELRIVEHSLPADTAIERALRAELVKAVADLNDGLTGQGVDTLDDDELLAAVQANNVAFSTVRRLIGRAKVEGVTTMVNDFLADALEAKLIVFCHHREVIRDLAHNLKHHSPLIINGETRQSIREGAIIEFQNRPQLRLIIIAIDSAGDSITLHAAHNVILMEPSPVPAKNIQAIARAYRNGQRNAVLARFVLLPGTLDARLMAIVARKTRDIARIVDNAPWAKTLVDFPDAM